MSNREAVLAFWKILRSVGDVVSLWPFSFYEIEALDIRRLSVTVCEPAPGQKQTELSMRICMAMCSLTRAPLFQIGLSPDDLVLEHSRRKYDESSATRMKYRLLGRRKSLSTGG